MISLSEDDIDLTDQSSLVVGRGWGKNKKVKQNK